MTTYLSVQDVIGLHEAVMNALGFAAAPLRDQGALESATMRARMAAQYEEADLIRQAALLGVGISQAKDFLDGNKRTAYTTVDEFLRINGFKFAGDPIGLSRQIELVAERPDSLAAATERFEQWLRSEVTGL